MIKVKDIFLNDDEAKALCEEISDCIILQKMVDRMVDKLFALGLELGLQLDVNHLLYTTSCGYHNSDDAIMVWTTAQLLAEINSRNSEENENWIYKLIKDQYNATSEGE